MRFTCHGFGAERTRPRASMRLGVGLVVATVLLSTACSDDDSDESSSGRTTTTSAAAQPTTTQPQASGDSQEAAFTIVESVVLDATDLTDRLLQNPALADDGSEIERLRELYTEDSPTPPEVLERLEDLSSNDQKVRPGPSGVFREFVVHGMAAVDATTVRFEFCASQDQETVDADGTVVATFAEVTQGTGEARYIDGRWRFYGLHRDDQTSAPAGPDDELAGFCETLYGGEGQA